MRVCTYILLIRIPPMITAVQQLQVSTVALEVAQQSIHYSLHIPIANTPCSNSTHSRSENSHPTLQQLSLHVPITTPIPITAYLHVWYVELYRVHGRRAHMVCGILVMLYLT